MPKTPKSAKTPKQIFQQSHGTLKAILKHSTTLLAIQSVVHTILCETVPVGTSPVSGAPADIPVEIQVASFNNGSLHLVTPSAALATRIKYSQQALKAALRKQKNPFYVSSIKISVRPIPHGSVSGKSNPEKSRPTRSAIPISAENGRHISNVAQYIEDEPLRKALIALSKRTS